MFRLVRWLYARACLSVERPSVLLDLSIAWLIERQVLLPGVSVLDRLVARTRDRASARVWKALDSLPTVEQRQRLESLLVVPPKGRQSALDRLRQAPDRISAPTKTCSPDAKNGSETCGPHPINRVAKNAIGAMNFMFSSAPKDQAHRPPTGRCCDEADQHRTIRCSGRSRERGGGSCGAFC